MPTEQLDRLTGAPSFIRAVGRQHLPFIQAHFSASRAQLFQDLFVQIRLGARRDGYFVEIGAGDGEYLSNTWMLEKTFGWRGILAEPNRALAQRIAATRAAVLDTRAVWRSSGERLEFLDVTRQRELSTLQQFQHADRYPRSGERYAVETVSLNDLLAAHGAPKDIDYMSIDTEGSELEILGGFDFARYRVAIFTIEHNFDEPRLARITQLLVAHGYARVHAEFTRFDAWFVRQV